MMDRLNEFRCPLCGSGRVDVGKLTHCSSVACALNRVDIRQEQWESRPLEEDLIEQNDKLRDTVSKQNTAVIELGQRLAKMHQERRERIAAWKVRKQNEENHRRELEARNRGHGQALKRQAPY
jgi:hypothetical protein